MRNRVMRVRNKAAYKITDSQGWLTQGTRTRGKFARHSGSFATAYSQFDLASCTSAESVALAVTGVTFE